ncbi:MAG: hypothetical protein ACRD3F_11440, partial [Acidobacteriaceae bacterium]
VLKPRQAQAMWQDKKKKEETFMKPKQPSRRAFLGATAAAASVAPAMASTTQSMHPSSTQSASWSPSLLSEMTNTNKKVVAIQIPAVSFSDEGVNGVLDTVQQRGGVNTLMIAAFSYGRGIEGRQIPGHPLPDHGKQEYDTKTFHGGDYATIHKEYYSGVVYKDFRAPELGKFDVLGAVVPEAKKRGMKSICWFEDVYNPRLLDNFEQVAEVDIYGRKTRHACMNNPYNRNFLRSIVQDWTKSYDVDGVMWCSERQGALNNAMDAHHGHAYLTCFCKYCVAKGKQQGINVDRAREGLTTLDGWVRATWSQPRPPDGYFVTFWRILMEYPEIVAWQKFWHDSQNEVYGVIYGTAKSINDKLAVGFHIMHHNSFCPFYRAEQDYRVFRPFADMLKICMYNNCGGPRLANYIETVHNTIFKDMRPENILEMDYHFMGFKGEAPLDKLRTAGLSSKYVFEETKRALADVQLSTVPIPGLSSDYVAPPSKHPVPHLPKELAIWPGIDVDIPTGKGEKKTQPSDVLGAVKAAFNAGAPGIIYSRKYSEMKLDNLSAGGKALKELGIQS